MFAIFEKSFFHNRANVGLEQRKRFLYEDLLLSLSVQNCLLLYFLLNNNEHAFNGKLHCDRIFTMFPTFR